MKSKLLIASATLALLFSCKQNPNGNYIAYEANPYNPMFGGNSDFDQNASDKLSSEIQGKIYKLDFDKDYIILTDARRRKMVLNRKIEYHGGGSSDTSYKYTNILDGQKAEFTLRPNHFRGEYIVDMWIRVYRKSVDSMGNPVLGKFANISSTLKRTNSN